MSENKIIRDIIINKINEYFGDFNVDKPQEINKLLLKVISDLDEIKFKNKINDFDFSLKLIGHFEAFLEFSSLNENLKEVFYREISNTFLKDFSDIEKVKFLEKSGVDLNNSPFIFNAFNLPGYNIKFDKPILINFAKKDYNTGDYVLRKAIVDGIDYNRATIVNSKNKNEDINLSHISVESRHDIFQKLDAIAKSYNLESHDLPIMNYYDKYVINGNPFYDFSFILDEELRNGSKSREGQDLILDRTKTLLNYLMKDGNLSVLTKIKFEETQNEIDILFSNAMSDKSKRLFLDSIIQNFDSKNYNKDVFDLIVPETVKKRVKIRLELMNDLTKYESDTKKINKNSFEPEL